MLIGMAAHLLVPTSDKCFKQMLQFCYVFVTFMFEPTSFCVYKVIEFHGKAIPLQALTGPEGSRRLRLPDFKTIGT
jgi:hypothetical protein